MTTTKKYQEIDLGYKPKRHSPFTMYFCYPKGKPPVVVKGNSDKVRSYVEKNLAPCVAYYSFWKDNQSRGNWRVFGARVYISKIRVNNRVKYSITTYDRNNVQKVKTVRRIPKAWLSEYDVAIKK